MGISITNPEKKREHNKIAHHLYKYGYAIVERNGDTIILGVSAVGNIYGHHLGTKKVVTYNYGTESNLVTDDFTLVDSVVTISNDRD